MTTRANQHEYRSCEPSHAVRHRRGFLWGRLDLAEGHVRTAVGSPSGCVLRTAVTSRNGAYRLLYVDLHTLAFWQAFFVLILQPMIRNCLGILDHRRPVITRVCFNRLRVGVCVMALWMFLVGMYHDVLCSGSRARGLWTSSSYRRSGACV